jgi:hypothetical protein
VAGCVRLGRIEQTDEPLSDDVIHEADLNYNVALIRRAVFAYWKRSIGIGLPIAGVILVANLGVLVAFGDRSWILGADATGLVLFFVFAASLYVVHYRNALAKLREMTVPHAKFIAEDAEFTLESGAGRSTLRWSTVKELWRYPDFWLLMFSAAHFVTLPLGGMSVDMQSYTLDRLRAAGAKIR